MPSNNEEGPSLNQIQTILEADGSTEVRIKPFPDPLDKEPFSPDDVDTINKKTHPGSFEKSPRKTPETTQGQPQNELNERNKNFFITIKQHQNPKFQSNTISILKDVLKKYCSNPEHEKLLKTIFHKYKNKSETSMENNTQLKSLYKTLKEDTKARKMALNVTQSLQYYDKKTFIPIGIRVLAQIQLSILKSNNRKRKKFFKKNKT